MLRLFLLRCNNDGRLNGEVNFLKTIGDEHDLEAEVEEDLTEAGDITDTEVAAAGLECNAYDDRVG